MAIKEAQIHVRFSDLDVLGHVNNNIYLSYFEIARVHYFGELLGKDYNWKEYGVVLVKNEVEYLKPVFLGDNAYIKMYVGKIGTKSFELSYELKVGDELRTRGSSVLVAFNGKTQKSIDIPEQMLKALETLKAEQ